MSQMSEVSNTFKACLDILRTEGITGDKALRNISLCLILKLLEPRFGCDIDIDGHSYDTNLTEDERTVLLEKVRFSKLNEEKEDNIVNIIGYLWDDILACHPATKNIFIKGKMFDIKHQSTYKKLIKKINSLDFTNVNYDVLGNIYEDVIKDIMTGKVLGQFFTPPLVKDIMVKLIEPQVRPDGTIESCCDPTMGTGGLLITYIKYIKRQASEKGIELDWKSIQTDLYGKELEPDTYQLAASNMLISTGHIFDGIENGDSIRKPIRRKFDNVIANPPFGIKGFKYNDILDSYANEYVPIKTDNAVSLFIQAIICMLKIGGKCAVVLPDGQDLFSKTNKRLVLIREYLMKTCDLKEIIYMPSGVFTNTSIKSCIFFFIKKSEGKDIMDTKIKISKKTNKETGRDYKFTNEHKTTSVKFYEYTDVKTLLVDVPIEKIVNNSYSLNYSEYIEIVEEKFKEGIEIKTLGEIFGEKTSNFITIDDNTTYNIVGLSSKGYSKISKQLIGSEIKTKRQQVCNESQFILSKILNGCYGYVNEETANGVMTGNFWLFNINAQIITKEYLYYIFDTQIMSQLKEISHGVSIPYIDRVKFNGLKIPIPSLDRQREIVTYLDFIYETAIKTSNEKIAELKRLNEFCLNNQRIFGENEVKTLGDICDIYPTTKHYSSIGNKQGLYKFYVSSQVCDLYLDTYEIGEKCIIIGNGGQANIHIDSKFTPSKHVTTCRINEVYNIDYIHYYLKNNMELLEKEFTGCALKWMNKTKLKSIKIPIPSLDRQREIVEYCDFNDSLIKQLEKEIENNKKQAQQFMLSMIN